MAPNVMGKVNEIGVITVERIAADIRVKKYRSAEQKPSKYQSADEEKTHPNKQAGAPR